MRARAAGCTIQGMAESTATVHVRCSSRGAWTVHPSDQPQPVSVHTSETDAEAAARRHPEAATIIVHDRYGRTHVLRQTSGVLGA